MGRIEAIKGMDALLAACRLAPEVHVVVAGPADETAQRTWLSQLPANVEYAGFLHGQELQQRLAGALAVVVPTICYENQPFSVLEAFAQRKPVIASDLGGLTELVADHERGLRVPPDEPPALAEAMRWLASHPNQAREMGAAAYGYVSSEHDASTHYQRILALYTRCLAIRAPGQAKTCRSMES